MRKKTCFLCEKPRLRPKPGQAEPWSWLWPGPALEKAGAISGRAKAVAFRPSQAGTSLLMTKYQWSKQSIEAFAQLFTRIETHPYCQWEYGERALIIYQARVRHEWHDQLKMGLVFNIGIINKDLLQSIYRELLDQAQLLSIREVSLFVIRRRLNIN